MKKLLPLLVVGILVLSGLGAVALNVNNETEPSSFDELDQSQTVMTENAFVPVGHFAFEDIKVNIQVAQSFIPSRDITTRVELFIVKNSTATYPLTVSIREELTEDDLTVINIDPSQVPTETFDWVEIDFDDVFLTTDQTYYIVALTENVTDNYYGWGANNISESYPDGCAWFSIDEGGTWTNESASSSSHSVESFFNQGAQPIFEDIVTWDMCFKTYGQDNDPPDLPTIMGPDRGVPGTEYTYTFQSTDPNGDGIFYCMNWGDGSGEVCIGPYASGEEATASHIWDEQGEYTIMVKSQDIHGAESDWAIQTITIPRNKALVNPLFLRFLERFQNAFPILKYVLGL